MSYSVDRSEVLRYLGYAGQTITPELDERIDGVIEKGEREIEPRFIIKYFDIDCIVEGGRVLQGASASMLSPSDSYVSLAGTPLVFQGRDIVAHLHGATAVGLFACTLGSKSEQELMRLGAINPLDAVIFDAACSALVECAADAAEAEIVAEAARRGLQTTFRYSPGYGDLSLEVQPLLLDVLGAGSRLGLTVTKTNMLLPTKSVTALVGMFESLPEGAQPRFCQSCHMKDYCTLRAAGEVCYARKR